MSVNKTEQWIRKGDGERRRAGRLCYAFLLLPTVEVLPNSIHFSLPKTDFEDRDKQKRKMEKKKDAR
jgi:hypothetical protein